MIFAILFWTSIFLIFYAYFGYPLSVWFLARFKKQKRDDEKYEPSVTLLIKPSEISTSNMSNRHAWVSRTLMPRPYMVIILWSNPAKYFWPLGISCGS